MVMETPSAQCVGREFVRQYYTLLHEAPLHLHRFYSHNSCFVHGGVEKPGEEQPPVQGQADIHKKICSLNFRDCHAKIRQVDSQATVGNAVVVQVTGELSNNGQQMRRFMQTFVLVPQSPKKYYVHNDIFRYQDEVFHDNDTDTENPDEAVDSESETDALDVAAPAEPAAPQSGGPSFFDSAVPQQPLSNGTTHVEEGVETQVPVIKATVASDTTEQSAAPVQQEKSPEPEAAQPARMKEDTPPTQQSTNAAASGKDQSFDEKQATPDSKQPEPEPEPQPTGPPQPVTWAAMISGNKGNSASIPPASAIASKPPSVIPTKPAEAKTETTPQPQPQRAPRPIRDRDRGGIRGERDGSRTSSGGPPGSVGGPPMGGDSDDTRRSRYPDSVQIFVGNLPHTITDAELKTYFGKYGVVLESRINKKGGANPHSTVPNFGFVVFEDEKAVANVLAQKGNLTLGSGHRLNVEEKKQRGETGRPGSGTRQGRGGMMGGRGGGMDRGGPGGRGRGMGPGGRGQDSRGRGSYAPRR